MELLILALVAIGAIETTYLVYKSRPQTAMDTHSLLLDTSVLIDGRILPIARSGLITAPLIIPRSVVRELQYMADKADHDKRERARAGLDMIAQLQHLEDLTVRLIDDPELTNGGVDERLVELAQKSNARLCTIDYNLNKAARVQGVTVVNINEIAHALRIVHLPGETVELKLVQPGQEARQAVGYLDDGTMVVVDDAKGLINQTIPVEVTRVLQTTAGKMMFARKVSSGAQKPKQNFPGNSANNSSRAKKNSSQTANAVSMVADSENANSSGQTASKLSMVADRKSNRNFSQTANAVNMDGGSASDATQANELNTVVAAAPAESNAQNQASPRAPRQNFKQRNNPQTNRAVAQSVPVPAVDTFAQTPVPSQQQRSQKNPRRRKTAEDSLIELTKQQ